MKPSIFVVLVLAFALSSCVADNPAPTVTPAPTPTLTALGWCESLATLVQPDGLVTSVRVRPGVENPKTVDGCEVTTTNGADQWLPLSFFLPEADVHYVP